MSSKNQTPLLPIAETLKALELGVEAAHLDAPTLIIKLKEESLPQSPLGFGFEIHPVKSFLSGTSPSLHAQIIRGYHWVNWDSHARYCGRCGADIFPELDRIERKCPSCAHSFFPTFSPAIMVLIQKENEILLVRSPHFRTGVYSAIAGFVDLGETAEEAIHREVKEEVGLEISDLEYFSTQTWPFPNSFMIAFKARYLGGEIKLDDPEIEDARWFSQENLPKMPFKASIAHALIQSALMPIDRQLP